MVDERKKGKEWKWHEGEGKRRVLVKGVRILKGSFFVFQLWRRSKEGIVGKQTEMELGGKE